MTRDVESGVAKFYDTLRWEYPSLTGAPPRPAPRVTERRATEARFCQGLKQLLTFGPDLARRAETLMDPSQQLLPTQRLSRAKQISFWLNQLASSRGQALTGLGG